MMKARLVALAAVAVLNGALAYTPAGVGFLPGRVAVSRASPSIGSSVEMMVRTREARGTHSSNHIFCGRMVVRTNVGRAPTRARAPPAHAAHRAPLWPFAAPVRDRASGSDTRCAAAASAGPPTSARPSSGRLRRSASATARSRRL